MKSQNEKTVPIKKNEYDFYFSKSRTVFAVVFDKVCPPCATEDLPTGYNKWMLHGRLLGVYKGRLIERTGDPFTAEVRIYSGPELSRPVGFWVNRCPVPGESWVLFTMIHTLPASMDEIFKDNMGFAVEMSRVGKFLPKKN